MQFKRIIASIDVSDELAEKVLTVASNLAARDGAALEAVSVWPAVNSGTFGTGSDGGATAVASAQIVFEQHKSGRKFCEEKLGKLVAKVAPQSSIVILDGDPSDEVAAYAEKTGADIIVTGSHQRGFWGRLLLGSESRELVHDAPCAVFIVTRRFAEKI